MTRSTTQATSVSVPSATGIFGTVVLSNGSTGFASHYDSVKDSINQAYRDIYEAVKAQ